MYVCVYACNECLGHLARDVPHAPAAADQEQMLAAAEAVVVLEALYCGQPHQRQRRGFAEAQSWWLGRDLVERHQDFLRESAHHGRRSPENSIALFQLGQGGGADDSPGKVKADAAALDRLPRRARHPCGQLVAHQTLGVHWVEARAGDAA